MIGSINDHATALCCYLLGLKMDVWLVLGYGIPHGHAAWVFSKEYTTDQDVPTHYIYDVVQNEKYNVTDEFCTLLKIYCVLNGENVSKTLSSIIFVVLSYTLAELLLIMTMKY